MEVDHSVLRFNMTKGSGAICKLFDPAIFTLIAGVGLNFFRFLRSLGMSGEKNLVVLSSRDHYSCDKNELKNVRILVNLRKLNLIKHLDVFLGALVRILPPDTSFVGYFSDGRPARGSGNNTMNRHEVMNLLGKNGFKTIEMKEINGLTYFISQNVGLPF